jgi:hypothetical protein
MYLNNRLDEVNSLMELLRVYGMGLALAKIGSFSFHRDKLLGTREWTR